MEENQTNDEENGVSWFETISPYVTMKIFSFLDPSDICKARLVCWNWNLIANDRLLWAGIMANDARFFPSHSSIGAESGVRSVTSIDRNFFQVMQSFKVPFTPSECFSSLNYQLHDEAPPSMIRLTPFSAGGSSRLFYRLLPARFRKDGVLFPTPIHAVVLGPGIDLSKAFFWTKISHKLMPLLIPTELRGLSYQFGPHMVNIQFLHARSYADRNKSQAALFNRYTDSLLISFNENNNENRASVVETVRSKIKRASLVFYTIVDGLPIRHDWTQELATIMAEADRNACLVVLVSSTKDKAKLQHVNELLHPDERDRMPLTFVDIAQQLDLSNIRQPWLIHGCGDKIEMEPIINWSEHMKKNFATLVA